MILEGHLLLLDLATSLANLCVLFGKERFGGLKVSGSQMKIGSDLLELDHLLLGDV
jgi:hypothetical protein